MNTSVYKFVRYNYYLLLSFQIYEKTCVLEDCILGSFSLLGGQAVAIIYIFNQQTVVRVLFRPIFIANTGRPRSSFLNLANGCYNQSFACAIMKHSSGFMLQNVAVMTLVLYRTISESRQALGLAGYNLERDR